MQVTVNNNASVRVDTRMQPTQGADGQMGRQLIIDIIADDLASGGKTAQAGQGRFEWPTRV